MRGLLVMAFIVIMNVTYAQVAVGIYGGLNQTKFSGDAPRNYGYEFKGGYVLGITFDKSIDKDVFISVRPNFTRGGANVVLQGEDVIIPTQQPADPMDTLFLFPVTTQYVALPVLFQIYVRRGFYANSGLDLTYSLSAEADVFGTSKDVSDKVNDFGLNAIFGFGGSLPIKGTSINLEFSYAQGLTTYTIQEDIEEGTSPRLRTRRFRLAAYFIVFTSKKKL